MRITLLNNPKIPVKTSVFAPFFHRVGASTVTRGHDDSIFLYSGIICRNFWILDRMDVRYV